MKKLLIVNSISIILAIGALVLCVLDKQGWGWFLLASVLCANSEITETKGYKEG